MARSQKKEGFIRTPPSHYGPSSSSSSGGAPEGPTTSLFQVLQTIFSKHQKHPFLPQELPRREEHPAKHRLKVLPFLTDFSGGYHSNQNVYRPTSKCCFLCLMLVIFYRCRLQNPPIFGSVILSNLPTRVTERSDLLAKSPVRMTD